MFFSRTEGQVPSIFVPSLGTFGRGLSWEESPGWNKPCPALVDDWTRSEGASSSEALSELPTNSTVTQTINMAL